jgi:hypothetical protein
MKKTINIFIVGLLLTAAFSCKKEKKDPAPIANPNPAPAVPLTVTSIPENTGYQKIYSVKLYRNIYPTGQIGTSTLIRDFTYTCTVIGDTTLANNIPAKRYLHIFSHPDFGPIRSYSYLSNNMWHQIPLDYGDFVLPFYLPLPVTIGQHWGQTAPTHSDTVRVDTLLFEKINNINVQCFRVPGLELNAANFQDHFFTYYIGAKGIVKIDYNYYDGTNPNQIQIDNYIVALISSNF